MPKDYINLFHQMEDEMERMTSDALRHFQRGPTRKTTWQPRADVCETHDAVIVIVELAGLTEDEIERQVKVTLSSDDRALRISGHRDEPSLPDERVACHQLEIMFGPFERIVPLPNAGLIRDSISAHYRSGLLRITLPKRPPESPRTIIIRGGL